MIKQRQTKSKKMTEAQVDESIMETFPASDPPSWTLGVDPLKSRAAVSHKKKSRIASKHRRHHQ